jgi:hypothetical protein
LCSLFFSLWTDVSAVASVGESTSRLIVNKVRAKLLSMI